MNKIHPLSACLMAGILLAGLAGRTLGEPLESSPPGQDQDAVAADLEGRIPSLIKDARIPGLQIAVIRDGRVVWHGNYGAKNSASMEPVTDETIFEAASLTKPFFAYYVMTLVDQGFLALDKPLVGYVSTEFVEKLLGHPLNEKGFHRDWAEKITIRHVLSHSSGMPHGETGRPFPLFFEPGTKWKYSADGYFFLQKVIETLKGDKLENLMRKEIIEPLGMTRSSLVWREDYEKTMANGHGFFGKPEDFRKRTESHAGASLYTTAEDYAKFVCAVLNGALLRPETLKEMLRPQIDMDKDKGLGWSLGFGTQTDDRGLAIWQWGDYGIFRNYIMAYPTERSAVVYLTDSFFGLGVSPELVAGTIGGQATGAVALNYWHYDSPVYRAGWAWAESGTKAAGELPGLAKEFPEAFSKDGMGFLAAIFEDGGRLPEFVAPLRFYADAHPQSGQSQLSLGKALMQAGDRPQAKQSLKKAGKAKEDKVQASVIKWNLAYIQALDKPKKLKESYLQKIAGSYGARQLELREGRLYYFRKGGSSPDFRPLVAMSKDTFVLETMSSFRLKIEFDKKKNPLKAVGIYEDGSRDETVRDK
jgi:CubicO group peptidase (beta-lactamase class C family)